MSELTVAEVMQRDVVFMKPGDRLDLVDDVMNLGRIRHVPVVEGDRLVGVVSQRDLLASSLSQVLDFDGRQRRTFNRSVELSEVMSRNPVTVHADAGLKEAARLMVDHKIGCLPVLGDADEPLGLVTETDLLRGVFEL
jgi:CBS domain-containing protein